MTYPVILLILIFVTSSSEASFLSKSAQLPAHVRRPCHYGSSLGGPIRASTKSNVCSFSLCSLKGAKATCVFKKKRRRRLITCLKFSRTKRSKKQCAFACPLFCLPPSQRPLASNGQRFCSGCQLQSFSCSTQYKVFGPVKDKCEFVCLQSCGPPTPTNPCPPNCFMTGPGCPEAGPTARAFLLSTRWNITSFHFI